MAEHRRVARCTTARRTPITRKGPADDDAERSNPGWSLSSTSTCTARWRRSAPSRSRCTSCTRARRCRAWPTSTSARRRWPSACARPCAGTTSSRARTAGTATASPRARRSNRMFAELLGKEPGYCRGKGGSDAHRRSRDRATWAPTPSSAARPASPPAPRSRRRCGAPARSRSASSATARSGQGLLYEAMNMAALWKLPGHLRLREQPLRRVHAVPARRSPARSWRRARAFGVHAESVDGQDVQAVNRDDAPAGRAGAPRRGPGVPRVQDLPLLRPPRRRREPRVPVSATKSGTG